MRRFAFVAAIALIAHITALAGGFVWLDHAHIEGGLALAQRSSVFDIVTHGFAGTGYYRPLMALSLSFDALVGGPRIFHATSLVCHAVAAVMTTFVAGSLGLSRRAAVLAGVLFAVHPLSTLVADAIAFRSEALVVIALLALIWAHLQNRPLVAAAAITLGGLSKETAIALAPLFVLALELTPRGAAARSKSSAVGRGRLFGAEVAALAFLLALRRAYAPSWRASYPDLDAGDAIGTRFAGVAKSIAAVLLPIDPSICDAFAITHWWSPASIAGLATVVAIAALAWFRRGPALLLAFAVLPALQLVPVQRWWSPHYLYVPFVFAAMLVGEFVDRRGPRTVAAAWLTLVVLGVTSLHNGRRWADDVALWTDEVARQPACREGQFYLGEVARRAGRWDAAGRRFESALAPRRGILAYVDRSAALQNLGAVRLEQGRFADAREAYRAALDGTRDAPTRRELTHNLAAAALGEGNAAEAASLLEDETARPDALSESLVLRAEALRRLGRVEEAQRLLDRRAERR